MKRNAYFDNARVLLIFLVVFGHMIQPAIQDSKELNTLYIWIYTFHMPAFIFLSGFFAKGAGNPKYILNLAKKLLIPYLIFQGLYTGYYLWIGQEGWQGVFYPQWSLWFLLSLFSWHLLLIIFKRLGAMPSIMIAITIGVIVGYFPEIGHTFSLSRTFVFFPFFLMGYWCTEKTILKVKTKKIQVLSLFVMIGLALFIYFGPVINTGWLLASKSYADLDVATFGGLARLLVYVIATVMSVSVFAWIPQKQLAITPIGSTTLYIYLLHGFFIQYIRQRDLLEISNAMDVLGVGIISGAIVLLLSNRKIRALWQPLIEGKMSIIRKTFQKQHTREGHSS